MIETDSRCANSTLANVYKIRGNMCCVGLFAYASFWHSKQRWCHVLIFAGNIARTYTEQCVRILTELLELKQEHITSGDCLSLSN